jgi:hypothetical protein
MSAQNNLGKQWKKVYRGIPAHPDEVNLTSAGTHWTPHFEVAKEFATHKGSKGTVIEGHVHSDEVVKPHTEEWYDMGGIRPETDDETLAEAGMFHHNNVAIFDPEHSEEQEVTIRPKGLVHVNRLHHFVDGINKSQNINATGTA